jgi:NitT/TauT family transport system ATP-binding protein
VSYEYGPSEKREGLLALSSVDLSVEKGAFVSILGPSGCGKTTLLKLIDGLLKPTGGNVSVNAEPVTGPGPDRGMVFQFPSLLPWRTVRGNVSYGLELAGVRGPSLRQHVDASLELVGLEAFQSYYPSALSGGMQQRVNIARAAALDPDILLMDEPFGSLDAQTREDLQLEFLSIFRRTGKTVVFVTHDIDEAIFMSDVVAVLTPRPGSVSRLVRIELPRPRVPALRDEKAFVDYHRILWDLLHRPRGSEG